MIVSIMDLVVGANLSKKDLSVVTTILQLD